MLTPPASADDHFGNRTVARADPNHRYPESSDEPTQALGNAAASISSDETPSEAPQLPERIALKSGVILHRDQGNDAFPYDLLEDPEQNKFYRLGPGEAKFIGEILAGKPVLDCIEEGIQGALADAAPKGSKGESSLSAEQAASFIGWLDQTQLLRTSRAVSNAKPLIANLSSLFFYRQPIGNPDPLLRRLHAAMGILFSWPFAILVCLSAAVSAAFLFANRSEFLHSYENLINPWRGLWLIFAWFLLKVVHEIGHGGTCKRYGGRAPVFGFAFICLMPVAYIDVSSGWLFPSRWQRLHVTLAGVIAELAIAVLATLVWFQTESVLIQNAAADILLLASVTTILFNLNPLLRFDGYFALSDITNIDNLYQHGQTYARYFGARYLLGVEREEPELPGHWAWMKVYGVAAACWRCVTLFGLLATASVMFAGAGVAIALGGCVAFIVLPLFKLVRFLLSMQHVDGFDWPRLAVRLTTVVMLLIAILFLLPADIGRTAPGIVEFDPPSNIHSPTSGFVSEVYVRNGDLLRAGQPILLLQNDELELELASVRTELAQVRQSASSARWEGDSAKLAAFNAELTALMTKEAELAEQVTGLLVSAPHNGRLVARNIENRTGVFIEKGQELCSIGNHAKKRLKISLSVWDAKRVNDWRADPIRVSTAGRPSWLTYLSRIETRATDRPADPSLTATGGGNLAVVKVDDEQDPVLTEPRVNAFICLDAVTSEDLQCGQRCFVRLSGWRRSLATIFLESFAMSL
ncbi:MAG: biotin/lipoyl-binding protein [Aureliella sp.]